MFISDEDIVWIGLLFLIIHEVKDLKYPLFPGKLDATLQKTAFFLVTRFVEDVITGQTGS